MFYRASLVWLVAVLAQSAAAQVNSVVDVEIVARLTGPDAINNTLAVAVGGTDLGHMVVHQGKTYFLFGDTTDKDGWWNEGGWWRSNVVSWSTDDDPSDGITFDGWVTNVNGHAREVIYSGFMNPITEIPTGAISIGDRIYAWFMPVDCWCPGGWTIAYSGLAYTDNPLKNFTIVEGYRLPADTNFGMVAASKRTDLPPGTDDYVYLWGTPSGRSGGVKLARVHPDSITQPSAYRFFLGVNSGVPLWGTDEYAAPYVIPPKAGEMSVMYNHAARRWTILYFSEEHYAIDFRQAPEPWGPWSEPISVATGAEFPGLYGSYMNPLYVEDNGRTVYFTMSLWRPYDVYLMRMELDVVFHPDLNGDGNVDQFDLQLFLPCMSGPSQPHSGTPTCDSADLDQNGAVDQNDFGLFQRCLNGPVPPDPTCAD